MEAASDVALETLARETTSVKTHLLALLVRLLNKIFINTSTTTAASDTLGNTRFRGGKGRDSWYDMRGPFKRSMFVYDEAP